MALGAVGALTVKFVTASSDYLRPTSEVALGMA